MRKIINDLEKKIDEHYINVCMPRENGYEQNSMSEEGLMDEFLKNRVSSLESIQMAISKRNILSVYLGPDLKQEGIYSHILLKKYADDI